MIPKGLILPAATMGALLASTQAQATGTISMPGIGFGNSGFGFGNSGSKGHDGRDKDVFHDLGGSKSATFGGRHYGISFGKDHGGKGTVFDPKGHGFGGKDHGGSSGGKDHGSSWGGHGGSGGGIHLGKDWLNWTGHNHGGPGHHHNPGCGHDGGEEGNPTPPVPEPATWAFMIVGFGLIGAATRRRPRTARTTIQYS